MPSVVTVPHLLFSCLQAAFCAVPPCFSLTGYFQVLRMSARACFQSFPFFWHLPVVLLFPLRPFHACVVGSSSSCPDSQQAWRAGESWPVLSRFIGQVRSAMELLWLPVCSTSAFSFTLQQFWALVDAGHSLSFLLLPLEWLAFHLRNEDRLRKPKEFALGYAADRLDSLCFGYSPGPDSPNHTVTSLKSGTTSYSSFSHLTESALYLLSNWKKKWLNKWRESY